MKWSSCAEARTLQRQEERPLGHVHFPLAGASFAESGHRVEQNPAHHTSAVGTSGSDTQKHPCWRGSNDTGCTRATAAASTSASVEEASLRSAEAARATPQHLRADFSRSPKTADRHCWIFIVSPPGAAATLPGAGRAAGATAERPATPPATAERPATPPATAERPATPPVTAERPATPPATAERPATPQRLPSGRRLRQRLPSGRRLRQRLPSGR